MSTPTARVKILSLTETGDAFLRSTGIAMRASRTGGAEHEYWKYMVGKKLETLGYTVTGEQVIGRGRTVDLHATRADRTLWVETGRSDVAANMEKSRDLEGTVVFIFTSQQLRDAYADQAPFVLLTTRELDRLE